MAFKSIIVRVNQGDNFPVKCFHCPCVNAMIYLCVSVVWTYYARFQPRLILSCKATSLTHRLEHCKELHLSELLPNSHITEMFKTGTNAEACIIPSSLNKEKVCMDTRGQFNESISLSTLWQSRQARFSILYEYDQGVQTKEEGSVELTSSLSSFCLKV